MRTECVQRVATRVVAKICGRLLVPLIFLSRVVLAHASPRAMAAAPADDITAALETVEKRTRAAIDALRGLEAIAQSNDPDNAAIPQCLQSVVDSFEQIRACEASVGGVQVPRDVVESVDQGRNPDAFLAELAERNAAAGRAALGKTSAMDALARSVQQRAEESGLLAPVPRRSAGGPV